METGLGGKSSGSRAGCDLECPVRVPLGWVPRPQIRWLWLLAIPFLIPVNLVRGEEDGHLFSSLEGQKISNGFPLLPRELRSRGR